MARMARMMMYGVNGQSAWEGEEVEEDLLCTPFSRVEEEGVNWLWPGRIPLGEITLLDGDPGLGKSLLTLDLAARVSTGREMPDGAPGMVLCDVVLDGEVTLMSCGPAPVLLLSAEDDPARTILPRLRAAGANLAEVELLGAVKTRNLTTGRTTTRPFQLPQDIPRLEEAIEVNDAALVVIDPLMAYLALGVNSWRDQDVRAALAPLADVAQRTWTAILILRHLNKATGSSALYRGGGSIGIVAAARSGLLVAKHPDDPDHERVLTATKSNLGPPMPALRYRITADAAGDETRAPYVEWLGECDLSAEQALAAASLAKAGPSPSKVAEALEWLYGSLAAGARPGQEVEQAAHAVGISGASLRRAREQLGVRTERRGFGPEMRAWWSLSEEDLPTGEPPPAAMDGDGDAPVVFTSSSHVQPPDIEHN